MRSVQAAQPTKTIDSDKRQSNQASVWSWLLEMRQSGEKRAKFGLVERKQKGREGEIEGDF